MGYVQKKVIDLSHWNGNVDFKKVKKSGVWGVILKAGGSDAGLYKDSYFDKYYKAASAVGLNIGAYYFVGKDFLGSVNGKADGERFVKYLNGQKFSLPVYVDIEPPIPTGKQKQVLEAVKAFGDVVEGAGYYFGIYGSNVSTFTNRINYEDVKDRYTLWIASYPYANSRQKTFYTKYNVPSSKKPKREKCGIWQFTSKGKVSGISGNVDLSWCYWDFPDTIKNEHFNNY